MWNRLAVLASAIVLSLAAYGGDGAAAFVKRMECFKGSTYRDSGGRMTIGYGCTSSEMVGKGRVSRGTAAQAVFKECQRISGLLHREFGGQLLEHEEIALVSFVYNVGWTGFCRSRMYRLLKAGHRGKRVVDEFGRWVYFTRWGRKFKREGLCIRRNAEAQMFMYGRVA